MLEIDNNYMFAEGESYEKQTWIFNHNHGITTVLLIERFWDGSNQIQTMRFKNVNY